MNSRHLGSADLESTVSEKQAYACAPGNRPTNLLLTAAVVLLAQFACNLDAAGLSTTLAGTLNPSLSTSQWTYDNLSRLKTVSIQAGPASSASVAESPRHVYERVGNRTERTGNLGAVLAQTQTIDPRDQLDNADDPTPRTPNRSFDANTTSVAWNRYEYDLENRLISVNGGAVQITYDGDGHRVRKTAPTVGGGTKTTWYLVDDLNPTGYAQVLEEWETSDTEPPALVRNYTYGSDLISVRDSSDWFGEPTTHYYGHDGHGSVRFLTGETASAITDTYTYDAFGVFLAQTPIDAGARTPNHYLYAGEQWDSDLGFYYNRARYLDPNLGRFWTMDTFEGNQSDPLSLHKYLYAQADPVNRIDPSGYFCGGALETEEAIGFGLTIETLQAVGVQAFRQGLARGGSGVILKAGAAIIIGAVLVPVGVGVVVSLKELEDDSGNKEKLLYRAMKDESGSPRVGDGTDARSLTVRPSPPYPADEGDVTVVGGVVRPGQGLSVAPGNPRNLQPFRRPRSLEGTGKDPVWVLYAEVLKLNPQLSYRKDTPTHGLIEPSFPMPLNTFQRALGETQEFWSKFAPGN